MHKSVKTLMLLVTTLLFVSLWLLLTGIAEGAPAEIEYIQRGWTSPESGYYMTEQAGRDILAGWNSDRAAKEIYEAALDDMSSEWQVFRGDMAAQITTIEESLAVERAANKAALRRARAPNLGVFTGLAYSHSGEIRFVVGIGIVYKIIQ